MAQSTEPILGMWDKCRFMGWDGIYQVASTRIGQRAFSLIDRILCIVEAVNFYAAPKDQQEEARKHTKLSVDERPLPWTIYIPVIIFCRFVREFLSLAAALTQRKFNVITAVYHIQSWRTSLKAVKIEGARQMSDPKRRLTALPWPLRYALNLIIWGPLQFLIIVTNLVVGNKTYNSYAKRYLKKLRSTPANECTTLELIDKLADEDEQDDPDFEVKDADLVSETEEDDDDDEDVDEDEGDVDDLVANSDAEEDAQVKNNGSPKGGENGHSNGNGNYHGNNDAQQGQDQNHQEQQNHHENQHHYD